MHVAIPLFGREVAPRFGCADEFLIAKIEDGHVSGECSKHRVPRGWLKRINYLSALGIDTILCCGFRGQFVPLARSMGIDVITGLIGDAQTVLADCASGELSIDFRGGSKRVCGEGWGWGRSASDSNRASKGRHRNRGAKGCRRPSRGRHRRSDNQRT